MPVSLDKLTSHPHPNPAEGQAIADEMDAALDQLFAEMDAEMVPLPPAATHAADVAIKHS